MRRKTIFSLILVTGGVVAALYLGWPRQPPGLSIPPSPQPSARLTEQDGRFLFNVTLHTPQEIDGMLARAEQLARTTHAENAPTGIALVLHGPEIEIFAKKNYPRFRETVDLAARLDAEHVIEIKMCRTEMRNRGIREEDIPAFIELVPYGPDEEERLRRSGYVYL